MQGRPAPRAFRPLRALGWALLGLAALAFVLVLLFAVVAPPVTPTMLAERSRLGGIRHEWVPIEDVAPVMARAVVAAEDANYCLHWGFDMAAIRLAIAEGGQRGASTLSQQTVKNVFLWQGRSWPRKALEALLTPLAESVWSKRRILEVYLNVAEMGPGVFGVEAAARHWFGVGAGDLTPAQAARIAAILPAPRDRSPAEPSGFVRQRAAAIMDGAETIRRDGRAACFQG
ncbi:monofunctional biosynthetic peptidoglycan transglycosylase [Roseitranquillus sediminis]|uniref:monofunctional biosynthetic peptidoglycan transglycosylase n=1 Tax=Roseitranquillus sediminis TaxID=2809051 RepID=UPI001D0C088F|nr:monofunctional biosynthetic peptidoglycan transglycosylase [Roseitranquillus sediminis]MBM9593797.1 monofunctional biosynthetic peptidoglycan transglycosylase [Roseitranquillus sediminis]